MIVVNPLDFVRGQVESMNPVTSPVWITGLLFCLALPQGRRFRLLGWMYTSVFLLLMLNRTSRSGYLAPSYTWLFAAGGTALEAWISRPLARVAVVLIVALGGIVTAPFALPLLPVESYFAYATRLGVEPSTEERKELGALPQFYADMHGWPELLLELERVTGTLAPDERKDVAILSPNYGVAGAIDVLGRKRGLPPAISGHNSYWLWGPGSASGEVLISVGGSREGLSRRYRSVQEVGRTACRLCMPYENDRPIWICREPQRPLRELWPSLKHYD